MINERLSMNEENLKMIENLKEQELENIKIGIEMENRKIVNDINDKKELKIILKNINEKMDNCI